MSDIGAGGVRVAYPLFHEGGSGAIPTSALHFRIESIAYDTARELNKLWHSRLPRIGDPPEVMKAGIHYGAIFEGLIYAVAIWTHPVNRSLPQEHWLELRRLAIAPDAPRNMASRMLAVMARLIRRSRPGLTTLVSYHDTEVHTGGIYRAAGWKESADVVFKSWTSKTRVRPADQSSGAKKRWELKLRAD